MDFVNGGLAAIGACIISNPFDVIKTRMQLQGELSNRGQHVVHYRNALHGLYIIGKMEGLSGLQKGLVPAINYQVVMNGIRLGLYQTAEGHGWTRTKEGDLNFFKSVLWGCVAGIAGTVTGSPLYLIKVQIQSNSDERIAVGHQHKHLGFIDAFKTIYRKNGFLGLWTGVSSAVPRVALGSSAQLATFSTSKEYLISRNICVNSPIVLAFLASCTSGLAVVIFMNPFDVVATRLYNQNQDTSGKGALYRGVIDCLIKIYKAEGFFGLYKGVGAQYLRVAPHTTVCLVLWDKFNSMNQHYLKSS